MKIFIAGAKSIMCLDDYVVSKLHSIREKGYDVIVGDCTGVDSLVQEFFKSVHYPNVTVYASQGKARNNLGLWPVHAVPVPDGVKGFAFYRQKDIAMAHDADCGFMIWDGNSKGTKANIQTMTQLGKKVIVHFPSTDSSFTVPTEKDIPNTQLTSLQISML